MSSLTDDVTHVALKEAFDNLVALIKHAQDKGWSIGIKPAFRFSQDAIECARLVGGSIQVTKTL
jgi:hypothetical protein